MCPGLGTATAVGVYNTETRCTQCSAFHQVKIFEEDFQRERSDRERMNEEKEELKQQLEKLQKQLAMSNNQVSSTAPFMDELEMLISCVAAPSHTSEQG